MAGINHFAAEGSAHEFASSRAAEGHRKPQPSTDGALIRAALLGWLLAFLVGAGCLLAGENNGRSRFMPNLCDARAVELGVS